MLFRPPRMTDIIAVAIRMREADRVECRAAGADDLLRALRDGVARSDWSRTALVDEGPMCIFGVCPLGVAPAVGVPWMLGTPLVQTHARTFVRRAIEVVREMLLRYPTLMNYVHADNALAVRWLRRTGFVLSPAEPFGPRGALFHRFELRA